MAVFGVCLTVAGIVVMLSSIYFERVGVAIGGLLVMTVGCALCLVWRFTDIASQATSADDRAWCQSIEGTVYSAEGNCYKNGIKLKKGEE